MTKQEMRQWQEESVQQAYEELENEMMIQFCGFVPPTLKGVN